MAERLRPAGYGTGVYEEKRSRFIGELFPIPDEEQAKQLVSQTRKKYPDARHHCWAYVLPDGACRWSDDGEPGGTAGAPMADVLRGAGVFGALCVVTRYFGGVLLGSGGLVRAYSKAAALALDNAGTQPDPELETLRFTCRWEYLDRAHRLVREYGSLLNSGTDGGRAVLTAQLRREDAELFRARFTEATLGGEKFF